MPFLVMERITWRSKAPRPFFSTKGEATAANELQRSDVASIEGLAYDSWVTIGYEDNYMNALTAFLMDFSEFEAGVQLYTNNGAWFVTPDMRQAAAGPDGKLLIMQLTTEGDISGRINLHGRTRPLPRATSPTACPPG